jgi:hypothetical protein
MLALALAPLLLSAPAHADLDVAFVLDTTGSMSGELGEAKRRVKELSSALKAARPQETVRIGVVAFRDRGDAYVTTVSPLTSDVEETYGFLAELRANGGGDGPEDVLSGLHGAIHKLAWGEGAERQVFLIGDAPPHLDYEGHHDPDALMSQAADKGIVLNTIGCRSLPPRGIDFFRRVAYATEGSYQHIGRVRADEGGLADAVLDALVEAPAPGGPRTPLAAFPERDRGQPPTETLAEQGVLVRLGTWWDATERAPAEGAACTLTVLVPDGIALSGQPAFETSELALHATVPLSADPSAMAHARTYELARCVDVATPVVVAFKN